jgi:hypothetical protein
MEPRRRAGRGINRPCLVLSLTGPVPDVSIFCDLDQIHVDRLRAVLKQALPVLRSVDGTALEAERDYRRKDVDRALASFC